MIRMNKVMEDGREKMEDEKVGRCVKDRRWEDERQKKLIFNYYCLILNSKLKIQNSQLINQSTFLPLTFSL